MSETTDAYKKLARWQLARDLASWTIPAFIVGAVLMLLFEIVGEVFR